MAAHRSGRDRLWLAGIFLLALALRLLPWAAAHRGELRLLSPDCYGHLRRSQFVARQLPHVPVFDSWLNHPEGGVWIWPPGFDLVVGGTARLLHGAGVTLAQTTQEAAAIPPLLGALHVLPLFALARRALGRRRALLACGVYALVPSAILWSCYGHADHHVAEALTLLTLLAACARILDPGLDAGARMGRALVAGLALAAALLVWQGAVFAAAIALFWSLLALGPLAPVPGAVAAAVVAIAVWLYEPSGRALPFSFVNFGWFQPLLVAAGTVPLALRAAFSRDRRVRRAAIALAIVLAAVVSPHAARLATTALRGGGYVTMRETGAGHDDFSSEGGFLSYPPELMKLIAEAQPLLPPPRGPSLVAAVRELSFGLLLLPIALLSWGAGAVRRRASRSRRGTRLLLLLFGATLLLMTLFQRRNVYYLAAFTAMALAEGAARLDLLRRVRGRTFRPVLPAAAAVLLVAIPGGPLYRGIAAYAGAPGADFVSLLSRLRQLDPPPRESDQLPSPPAGAIAGVMAPWSAGHIVTAVAGRPAAADPFQYGWRRQARLFSTPDPTEALRILREARCRYLLTADLGGFLVSYARAAGNGDVPPPEMFLVRAHFGGGPHPFPFLTRVLDSRTGTRLPDGRFLPQFQVFRVDGVDDEPGAVLPR